MSTHVKLYAGDSHIPLYQTDLEFYQLSMLLDELSVECEAQECHYARVDVFERGHLVRSYRTYLKTKIHHFIDGHWL
ncbi:hypothetical protein [Vibrio sp. 10N]|uniref:hypothetical protein n=1 Tax=Vibrio sp. 10N TaxID=3058938 RepID=UPI0028134F8A|nr:hypothetical protein VB10N_18420 [Vibrio sp. 10N]